MADQKQTNSKSFLDRLYLSIYLSIYLLVLFLILNFRYYYSLEHKNPYETIWGMSFIPMFWAFSIQVILSLISSNKVRILISRIALGVFTFLYLIESFVFDTYSMLFSIEIVTSAVSTNLNEASEFFSFSSLPVLRYLFSITGLLFAIIVALSIKQLTLWSYNTIKGSLFIKLRKTLPIIVNSIIIIIGVGIKYPRMINYCEWLSPQPTINGTQLTPIERLGISILSIVINKDISNDYVERIKKQRTIEGISQDKNLGPHKFILVIGETLRPDYLHCYGYNLMTTPNLDKLVASGDLILFSDVVSSGPNTTISIPHLLSAKAIDDPRKWYEVPLLPTIMNSVGYRTSWLSNQESVGIYVQKIASIASLVDDKQYISSLEFDGSLLPLIEEKVKNNKSDAYTFDIVHIMGSHADYRRRYPKSFSLFTADDIKRPELKEAQKEIVAQYSNAAYYNDYVISQIIELNKELPCIILYLSDHGEAMFDDGSAEDWGHRLSVSGVSVPMMVYISPKMKALDPDLVAKVNTAKDKAFMSDLLPFSIMGLLGIDAPFYKPEYDIFSQDYDNNRPRCPHWDGKTLSIEHSVVKPELMIKPIEK